MDSRKLSCNSCCSWALKPIILSCCRCNLVDTILEMDRILRPQGWVIVRDTAMIVKQLLPVMQSLHWRTNIKITQTEENLIVAQKGSWRPETKKVLA